MLLNCGLTSWLLCNRNIVFKRSYSCSLINCGTIDCWYRYMNARNAAAISGPAFCFLWKWFENTVTVLIQLRTSIRIRPHVNHNRTHISLLNELQQAEHYIQQYDSVPDGPLTPIETLFLLDFVSFDHITSFVVYVSWESTANCTT